MTSNWTTKTIGEVSVNLDKKRKPVKGPDRKPGPYPYYGASGIVDYIDSYIFDGEHLLVAEDGENLRTQNTPIAFKAKGKFWVNNHAHILTGTDEVLTDYIRFWLLSNPIEGFLSGAVMPKLTQAALNSIPISFPTVQEQRRIVGILTSLEYFSESLLSQNTKLESIAQTIFKSWFVNFDPVHAKAAGREPEGLCAEIAALFPSEFEESELGLIPKGWKSQKLKECCVKIANGATPKRNEPDYWSNGNIPWLKTGEFSDGFVFDSEEQITALGAQKSSVKLFPPNTVLIALYGATVGKLAILGRESTFNQAATALTADDRFGQWLVYLWLKFRREWIIGMASGGAQQNISKAIVENTAVIRPSDNVLKVVNSILTPIFELMKTNSELVRILASLRDELLPRLISGKIRIEEAEEALADVVPSTEKQVA